MSCTEKSLKHFQPDDLKARYRFIKQAEQAFPISELCKVLKVSRSAYYAYRSGEHYQSKVKQRTESEQVKNVFYFHKRRYGTRRLVAELQDMGLEIGRKKVRSLLRKQGLVAIQPRSFVPRTTNSKHSKRVAPNLLLEAAKPTTPNQVWVGDITYIALINGKWAYLATWMDLYSRMIIGWEVDDNMEEDLIIHGLQKGLQKRNPAPGLIVHSDRGGQYVGNEFRNLLNKHHCRQSMSRADDPYDNAFAESFFSRFKAEALQNGAFLNLDDARTEVFEFIETYYNRIRKHSALGNKSPVNFEKLYYQNLSLNLQ